MRVSFRGGENVSNSIAMNAQLCEYTEIHCIVVQKYVDCTVPAAFQNQIVMISRNVCQCVTQIYSWL